MSAVAASLQGLDQEVFRWVNGGLHGLPEGVVTTALSFANQLGSGLLAVPILVVAVALRRRGRAAAVLQVLLALSLAYAVSHPLKHGLGRMRPHAVMPAEFVAGDVCLAFGEHADRMGFPSGHAVTYAALATVLGAWSRGLASPGRRGLALAGLALGALALGAARIYAGVHFPSDVVGGWGVGLAAGLGALAAVSLGRRAMRRWGIPASS